MPWSDELRYRDCPWCSTRNIALNVISGPVQIRTSTNHSREWTLLACPRCGGPINVETHPDIAGGLFLKAVPDSVLTNEVKHVPEAIAVRFQDAQRALDAGLWSAAVVELRRTLEGALKESGVEEKTLASGIKKLVASGQVTPAFSKLLEVVRIVGNQGAHFSDDDVTEESARRALAFTTQVLRNLFEVPGELKLLEEPNGETGPAAETSIGLPN